MQPAHVLSDLVLFSAGGFAAWICYSKLSGRLALLWCLFLVPAALAALFGALRFAEVHERMVDVSAFFRQMATTLGSCGLILGAYGLVINKPVQPLTFFVTIASGIILFLLVRFGNAVTVQSILPMAAMISVIAVAIGGIVVGRKSTGGYLLLAVLLSAAATWAIGNSSNKDLGIDLFHYLLAGSLVSFGLAAGSSRSR